MCLRFPSVIRLALIAIVLVVLVPETPSLAQSRGKVEGLLLDGEGNGVGKTQILVINEQIRSRRQKGKTKKNGKFVFPFVETGSYIFEVKAPGHRVLKVMVDSRAHADSETFHKEYVLGPKDEFPAIDVPFTGDYGHCKVEITIVKEEEYMAALRELRGETGVAEKPKQVFEALQTSMASRGSEEDPYEIGRGLAMAGKHEETIPHFQEKLQESPDDTQVMYALGRSQLDAGQTGDAEEALKKLVAINPEYTGAHYYLAQAQAANFKNAAAIQSYRKEIEISPDKRFSLLMHIANVQLEMANINPAALDQAKTTLEEVLAAEPGNVSAMSQLADIYRRTGDSVRQNEMYNLIAEADPENADVAFFNLGAMAFNENRREEAAANFQKAIEANPNHAEAHLQLGKCLVGLGKFPEAIAHLEQYLSLEPKGMHAGEAQSMLAQLKK